ncbi:hypothetical protein N0V93_005256 [Gnomoniopsis smithogilvyi]|uniref:Uncharacterized protein n=1 Tax=Gnomoniopsis smithogilvyi TaxID=1191159 RepID=A0A9W9CWK2_9PEZI|nr:hypothetical protein N0V93_005256 [Gnomoniopsis smithogilvyi]
MDPNDRSAENDIERPSASKVKRQAAVEDHDPEVLYTSGDGEFLPNNLFKMWSDVDPTLPREDRQYIFQTTFAEFRHTAPLYAQSWMYAANKSDVIAIEKARITNGGKIPASWKAAAEQSEHGRKWLKINQEQEQAEALARTREHAEKTAAVDAIIRARFAEAAGFYKEASRRAQKAFDDFESAASQAKTAAEWAKRTTERAAEAEEASDEACGRAKEARLEFMALKAARNKANIESSNAAAEVKRLENAATVVPQGQKRKLEAFKTEGS